MPTKGTIYRILIASPSDCVKERTAIPEIIYSWNSIHSLHTNRILEPVKWETHVTPEMGDRPQEIINRQIVDSCDILIGAFWTRLGTETGNHASGTAEEIDKFLTEGKRVLLYFSSAPVVPDSIDADQYKKLMEFKKSMRAQGITFDYPNIGEFRDLVSRHLSSLMAGIEDPDGRDDNSENLDQDSSSVEMFKDQFESFLRRFEAEWSAERDSEPYNIEDAQYIISSALDEVIHFRSQIVEDPDYLLIPIFSEASKDMKALGRHQLYMDGGKSFDEFWKNGDRLLEKLKTLPEALSR